MGDLIRGEDAMLVFAAVAYDKPAEKETLLIDETLFYKIGKGEKAAFCELYDKTRGAVYAYALSLLYDRHDAEDAAQETYLKIRSTAHLYKPQGKPMAWVLTIARNVCMMRFRQKKQCRAHLAGEPETGFTFGEIEDREDRMVLEAAFRVLSQEECQIIIMHAVSGLRHREIGEWLGLPLSTVLSKYNRGIRKLRRQLEGKL